ncbi:hypothetical protein N9D66_00060 [Candidatus Nanopelagicales bacterium]|nr:hypothetical protein [Candidatus Nanopelagicales bacterium]
MTQSQPSDEDLLRAKKYARLMDLRFVIACLFAIFGIIVTLTGVFASPEEINKAAGINISLWTGLFLLAFSASFWIWVFRSPPEVPTSSEVTSDAGDESEDENFQMP